MDTKRTHWTAFESRDLNKLHLDRNEPQEWTWLHDYIRESQSKTDFLEYPDIKQAYHNLSTITRFKPEYLMLTSGADDALSQILRLLASKIHFKEISMLTPTYAMAKVHASNNGFVVREIPYMDGGNTLSYNESQLENTVVYLANPDNPTGHTHSPILIEKLVNNGSIVIIDETYTCYNELAHTYSEELLESNRLYIIRSFSKTVGAGIKLGYIFSSKQCIDELRQNKLAYEISGLAASALRSIAANRHAYYEMGFDVIVRKREIYHMLTELDIDWIYTQTNFILCENTLPIREFLDKYCYYKIVEIDGYEYIKLTIPSEKDMKFFKDKFKEYINEKDNRKNR